VAGTVGEVLIDVVDDAVCVPDDGLRIDFQPASDESEYVPHLSGRRDDAQAAAR
jgi:hypothetical protein